LAEAVANWALVLNIASFRAKHNVYAIAICPSLGQDHLNPARLAANDAGTETHDGNAARAAPVVTS
jgi:hypothetical protein